MSVAGTVAAVGAITAAVISKNASGSASDTIAGASRSAIEQQNYQYETTREDFRPWREEGGEAIGRLGRASTGDMSDFQTSPGYNFRLGESTRAMDNAFSNRSGGGNAMRALADYSQNFASAEFGNWWNRQAGLAGVGQTATAQTSVAGMNAANQKSSIYTNWGENEASIGMWNAGNLNNAMQSGFSNALYAYNKKPYLGNQPGPG